MFKKNKTLLEKAIELALDAHAGQKDKAGKAYILHPLRLMIEMKTTKEKMVAILHDTIEDSDYTCKDLLKEGFPIDVVEAVYLLTRRNKDTYSEFIERIKTKELSRNVKIADIKHNSILDRISKPVKEDYKRLKKYQKALLVLESNK